MIRRFLRLYLIVIVPVAVLFVLMIYSIDQYWVGTKFIAQTRELADKRLGRIARSLQGVDVREWPQKVEAIRAIYPDPVNLLTLEVVQKELGSGSELQALQRGEVASRWIMDEDRMVFFKPVAGSSYVLSDERRTVGREQLSSYAWILFIAALIAAPPLFLWFRPFWKDVEEIKFVADEIGCGNFDVSTTIGQQSTLSPIAEAINGMAQRIRELLQNSADLSLAVAHELKTPITQLSLSVGMAKECCSAEMRPLVDGMGRDVAELDALVTELLAAAQLERSASFFPERVDFRDFLTDAADAAKDELAIDPDSSVIIGLGSIPAGPAYLDPAQMRRALMNLLRNAGRHAQRLIRVSATAGNGRYSISVEDDGPGISPEHRERVFEPFARLDPSRRRDTGGHGLGLSIVQRIARLHGGDAAIDDSPYGGARVTISW